MTIRQITRSLGALSEKWLDPAFGFRRKALKKLETRCGYPAAMGQEILDDLFSELTEKKLWTLLENELGNPEVLDGFRKDEKNKRQVRAFGPKSILHILAANVPQPSVITAVLGFLVKSRNIVKISSEDSGLLGIYAASLKARDPALAKNISILTGRGAKFEKALRQSCAHIVYGSNETIRHFSKKASQYQIFIPYGHRMSFGLYLESSLSEALAKKTAKDLWLMHQRGCLSPLMIFIRAKGKAARDFRTALTLELLSLGGSWKVHYQERPRIPVLWGDCTALIQSFDSVEEVFGIFKKFLPYLQAVTLEGRDAERSKVAVALAELGVNRICRAGRIQKPALSWHHDGRMNLAPLLRWTDLETGR